MFLSLKFQLVGMDELLALLRALVAQNQKPHISGGKFVIIVKDNQADTGYSISGVSATDAEGHAIPDAKLNYVVESTDAAVVAVTPDPDDQTKGTVSFGAPGVATVNVQVQTPDGTLLGSFAASFTVTEGDPAAIVGGSISFDGLADTP